MDPKEKHRRYMAEKVLCDCGAYVARSNMTMHKRGRNHKKAIGIKMVELKYFEEINGDIDIKDLDRRINELEILLGILKAKKSKDNPTEKYNLNK